MNLSCSRVILVIVDLDSLVSIVNYDILHIKSDLDTCLLSWLHFGTNFQCLIWIGSIFQQENFFRSVFRISNSSIKPLETVVLNVRILRVLSLTV